MAIKYSIDTLKKITINDKQFLIIKGWIYSKNNHQLLSCKINGNDVTENIVRTYRQDVNHKFNEINNELKLGFYLKYPLSDNANINSICFSYGSKSIIKLTKSKINHYLNSTKIIHYFDSITKVKEVVSVHGWAISDDYTPVDIKIFNQKGKEVKFDIERVTRDDVLENLLDIEDTEIKNIEFGFMIDFKILDDKDQYYIEFISHNGTKLKKNLKINAFDWSYTLKNLSVRNIIKGFKFIFKYGFKGTMQRIMDKKNRDQFTYEDFYKFHQCTEEELEKQRYHKFKYEPKISIIVPAYKTPRKFLNQMIDSVEKQTYSNYELCIADGSVDSDEVENVLKDRSLKNDKIKYALLDENYGISGNTNAALALATGDYIALLDHDDVLAASALYEIVEAINEDVENEVIYTDEDKVDMDLVHHFEPHFKPDFNLDLLRSNNYICHFFVVKKSIIDEIGGFRKEYDGSQDYDLILRCTEKAKKIKHLPRLLYHWRTHMNSTAANPESKMYCFEAGKKAIEDSLKRTGVEGDVSFTDHLGFYRVKYSVHGNPKVSIIIPNKDEKDTLDVCIRSILNKSTYSNYEIIIVENNSTEQATFDYYEEIKKDDRIQVVVWNDIFNYSKINNFGVQYASGDYYILLNNDTEIITESWIEEMLGNCQRKEVGICGAKLYYPDDTIQHAGVIIGLGGIAGHVFMNFPRDAVGYFAKCILQQDLSAVTAACLMIRKDVFEKVGGLEEKLQVAFNDIDLCLKVRKLGYLIVFDPYVELYHYESKSRGREDTAEKKKRFNSEIHYMEEKWDYIFKNGDPYFNNNLDLNKWDYSFKNNAPKLK